MKCKQSQLFVYKNWENVNKQLKTEKCKQTADWECQQTAVKMSTKSAVCLQNWTGTGIGLRSTSFKKVKTWILQRSQLFVYKNWEKVNKQLTEKCKQTAVCLQNWESKQTAEM